MKNECFSIYPMTIIITQIKPKRHFLLVNWTFPFFKQNPCILVYCEFAGTETLLTKEVNQKLNRDQDQVNSQGEKTDSRVESLEV